MAAYVTGLTAATGMPVSRSVLLFPTVAIKRAIQSIDNLAVHLHEHIPAG